LPFTIGLFGAWGEGKTTVVGERLREALREGGDYRAAYVYFDCWKYQGDPLRRQLVAEAARQLGSAGVLSKRAVARATEEFYEARSRVERVGVAPDRAAVVAGIVFAIALVLLYVLLRWAGTQIFGAVATDSVLELGGLLGAALVAVAGAFVARGTVTIQRSAVTEPEEFEKRFGDVLSSSGADRVVVVVDNLDRTSDDKIIETLGTLKSFSEHPKLLYLVACDVDAIKRVLQRSGVGEDSGADVWADEFLRKFFNAHVTLATHLEDDVRAYAEGLIAEAGLVSTNDSPVGDVILAALRRSPRRIKQLINVLVARLAVLNENDIGYRSVASVAKVVVIEEYWPDWAQRLRTHPEWLRAETQKAIAGSVSDPPQELVAFLRATAHVDVPDALAISRNRQLQAEKGLQDATLFREELLSGLWEQAKQRITDELADDYAAVALDQLRQTINRPADFATVAAGILRLADDVPAFVVTSRHVAVSLARQPQLRSHLTSISPARLVRAAMSSSAADTTQVALGIVEALSTEPAADRQEWREEAGSALAQSDVPQKAKDRLRESTSQVPLASDIPVLYAIFDADPTLISETVYEKALVTLETGEFSAWQWWPMMDRAAAGLSGQFRVRMLSRLLALASSEEPARDALLDIAVRTDLGDEEIAVLQTPPGPTLLQQAAAKVHWAAKATVVASRVDADGGANVFLPTATTLITLGTTEPWPALAELDPVVAIRAAGARPDRFFQMYSAWAPEERQRVLHSMLSPDVDVSPVLLPIIGSNDASLIDEAIHVLDEVDFPIIAVDGKAAIATALVSSDDDEYAESLLALQFHEQVIDDAGLDEFMRRLDEIARNDSQPDFIRFVWIVSRARVVRGLSQQRMQQLSDVLLEELPRVTPTERLIEALWDLWRRTRHPTLGTAIGPLVLKHLKQPSPSVALAAQVLAQVPEMSAAMELEGLRLIHDAMANPPTDVERATIHTLLGRWRARRGSKAYRALARLTRA
jgi:hypothetical protein